MARGSMAAVEEAAAGGEAAWAVRLRGEGRGEGLGEGLLSRHLRRRDIVVREVKGAVVDPHGGAAGEEAEEGPHPVVGRGRCRGHR